MVDQVSPAHPEPSAWLACRAANLATQQQGQPVLMCEKYKISYKKSLPIYLDNIF